MLKRLSTFRRKRDSEEPRANAANGTHAANGVNGNGVANGTNGVNGANGTNGTNGTNGASKAAKPTKRFSLAAPKRQATGPVEPDHSVTRGDIDNSFEQFAQLVHASRRPLPTQTGDASYIEHEVPSSLFQDIKSLGFKDVKTLTEVLQSKASGALADDKTMLMERIIQVPYTSYNHIRGN